MRTFSCRVAVALAVSACTVVALAQDALRAPNGWTMSRANGLQWMSPTEDPSVQVFFLNSQPMPSETWLNNNLPNVNFSQVDHARTVDGHDLTMALGKENGGSRYYGAFVSPGKGVEHVVLLQVDSTLALARNLSAIGKPAADWLGTAFNSVTKQSASSTARGSAGATSSNGPVSANSNSYTSPDGSFSFSSSSASSSASSSNQQTNFDSQFSQDAKTQQAHDAKSQSSKDSDSKSAKNSQRNSSSSEFIAFDPGKGGLVVHTPLPGGVIRGKYTASTSPFVPLFTGSFSVNEDASVVDGSGRRLADLWSGLVPAFKLDGSQKVVAIRVIGITDGLVNSFAIGPVVYLRS